MTLTVDYCGERYSVESEQVFTIGREADLVVDDNPYLHRQFLTVTEENDLPMLANVGNRLGATVVDEESTLEAFLGPGAVIPLVFPRIRVSFTAGSTSYEFVIENDDPSFRLPSSAGDSIGETTLGPAKLTPDQKLLIIAIAAPTLRGESRSGAAIPSSADAARLLDWTITKFNRKLDNVCQKFAKAGVQQLHGGPGYLASGRRARLVEYAVATRLVTADDLGLLPDSEAST